jgi:hypothetical protein
MLNMKYTLEEHRHRFAAWAASTAARSSSLCRFRVETGVSILEAAEFDKGFSTPRKLPPADLIDRVHRGWRKGVIVEAKKQGLVMSHGVAAKLINSYLKSRFLCGAYFANERVQALHPPIDRTLLRALKNDDIGGMKKDWAEAEKKAWSKYSSDDYEDVVEKIRKALKGKPLWLIEQYWKGHQ